MSIATSRHPRKSAPQWHQIVDAQLTSGLSAPKFCKERSIPYASIINWKKKLTVSAPAPIDTPPTFIELTPGPDTDSPSAGSITGQSVCIELDLGAGIQLRISRTG